MPRGKHLSGTGSKEQRMYEHIKRSAQQGQQEGFRLTPVRNCTL